MKIANFFYTNGNTSWHHKFATICVAPPLPLGVVSVDVKNHYIAIVYWLFKGAQELGLASILEQFVACYSYWLCERDPPSNLLLILFFPDFARIYTKTLLAMRNDPFMSSHESTPGHNWPTILDGGHCKAPQSYRPGPGYKATRTFLRSQCVPCSQNVYWCEEAATYTCWRMPPQGNTSLLCLSDNWYAFIFLGKPRL
jgi:hypothetical protein